VRFVTTVPREGRVEKQTEDKPTNERKDGSLYNQGCRINAQDARSTNNNRESQPRTKEPGNKPASEYQTEQEGGRAEGGLLSEKAPSSLIRQTKGACCFAT